MKRRNLSRKTSRHHVPLRNRSRLEKLEDRILLSADALVNAIVPDESNLRLTQDLQAEAVKVDAQPAACESGGEACLYASLDAAPDLTRLDAGPAATETSAPPPAGDTLQVDDTSLYLPLFTEAGVSLACLDATNSAGNVTAFGGDAATGTQPLAAVTLPLMSTGTAAGTDAAGMTAISGSDVLHVELGATLACTEAACVRIDGDLELAGALEITLADGYMPRAGDTFDIIHANSVCGEFTCGAGLFGFGDGSLWFDIVYQTDRVQLITRQTPDSLVLQYADSGAGDGAVSMVAMNAYRTLFGAALALGQADFSGFGSDLNFHAGADGDIAVSGQDADGAAFTLQMRHILGITGGQGTNTFVFDHADGGAIAVTGGAGTDELRILHGDNRWNVQGDGAGTVGALRFAGIENLTGGIDNQDTFVFSAGGHIAGTIDGNAGGYDTLVLDGGEYRAVDYLAFDPHSGTVRRDDDLITYAGLEPIIDNTLTTDRTLGMSIGNDTDAMLSTTQDGMLRLSGSTFEQIIFVKPTHSLTVQGLAGQDTLTLQTLNLGDTRLIIDAEHILLPQGQSLASNTDVSLLAAATAQVRGGNFADIEADALVAIDGTITIAGNLTLDASVTTDVQLSKVTQLAGLSIRTATSAQALVGGTANLRANDMRLTANTDSVLSLVTMTVARGTSTISAAQSTHAGIAGGATVTLSGGLSIAASDQSDMSTQLGVNDLLSATLTSFSVASADITVSRDTQAYLGLGDTQAVVAAAGDVSITAVNRDKTDGIRGNVQSQLIGMQTINVTQDDVLASVANARLNARTLSVLAENTASYAASAKRAVITASGITSATLDHAVITAAGASGQAAVRVSALDQSDFSATSSAVKAPLDQFPQVDLDMASAANTVRKATQALVADSAITAGGDVNVSATNASRLTAQAQPITLFSEIDTLFSDYTFKLRGNAASNQLQGGVTAAVADSAVTVTGSGSVHVTAAQLAVADAETHTGFQLAAGTDSAAGASMAWNAVGWDAGDASLTGLDALLAADMGDAVQTAASTAFIRHATMHVAGDLAVTASSALMLDATVTNVSAATSSATYGLAGLAASGIVAANRLRGGAQACIADENDPEAIVVGGSIGILGSAGFSGAMLAGHAITLATGSGDIGSGSAAIVTDLDAGGLLNATAAGNLVLTETDGDLLLGTISSRAGDLTLRALAGSMLNGLSDTRDNILGGRLSLHAMEGALGTAAQALRTSVTELEAHGKTGIALVNRGALAIAGGGLSLEADNGLMLVQATETLTVSAGVRMDAAGGAGALRLQSLYGDLHLNADLSTSGDAVSLIAHGAFTQAAGSTLANAAGTVDIEAGGAIALADGARMQGFDALRMLAVGDIAVTGMQSAAGSVALISEAGSVLDGGDSRVDIDAAQVLLMAAGGIGAENALDLSADRLAGMARGTIALGNNDDLVIGAVSLAVRHVAADGALSSLTDSAGGLLAAGDGDITLTAAGNLSVGGEGVVGDGAGAIRLTAGGDHVEVDGDILSGAGVVTLSAAQHVATTANARIATTGHEIRIRAAQGLDDAGGFSMLSTPGLLIIEGNQSFNATQTLRLTLGGTTPASLSLAGASYDQLMVTGFVTLAGGIDVSLADGFLPRQDDSFDILTYAGATGAFTSAGGLYGFGDGTQYLQIVQESDRVKLVARARPMADELRITGHQKVDNDRLGEFFNHDYFGDVAYDIAATVVAGDFFHADGGFTLEKSRESVTLSDGATVQTQLWRIGGAGMSAFAGINGPADSPNAIGLGLTGVDVALGLFREIGSDRGWLSLKALAGTVDPVGMDRLSVDARNVSVELNLGSDGRTVIDYRDAPIAVRAQTDVVNLDFDGEDGRLTQIAGEFHLHVGGFFTVDGSLAFRKANETVQLADGGTVQAAMLTVGGSGLAAFAGINGPWLTDSNQDGRIDDQDTPDPRALGLQLSDVGFALALLAPQDGQTGHESVKWLGLEARAGSAALVGMPGVVLGAADLGVTLNMVSGLPDGADADREVVNFAAHPLVVPTGTGLAMTLEIDGARGEMLRASGDVQLAVGGFFHVGGNVAFEKSRAMVTLADSTLVDTDVITVGGSGLYAFVGQNAFGADPDGADATFRGFSVSDVDFALALFTPRAGQSAVDGLSWSALHARVGTVNFTVGLPSNVTITPSDLSVTINQVHGVPYGMDADDLVIDFAARPFAVATGTGKSLNFTMSGAAGQLLRAAGHLDIAIGDSFSIGGSMAFEKSSRTVRLADGSTHEMDLLTLGGSGLSAFLGVNGPYRADTNGDGVIDSADAVNADARGLSIADVRFGMAMMWEKDHPQNATEPYWLTLQASAGYAELVGVASVTASASSLAVNINLAGNVDEGVDPDTRVVDFAATPLEIATGTNTGFVIATDGAKGELVSAAGHFLIGVGGFFQASGSVAIERHDTSVQLANTRPVQVGLLTVGGAGLDAFVGVNGPYLRDTNQDGGVDQSDTPDERAVGLSLGNVEFGLALMAARADETDFGGVSWTTLHASASSVALIGAPGMTLSARNLAVDINLADGLGSRAEVDPLVVDFAASPLTIATGAASSLALNTDGSLGRLVRASGDVTLDVASFFHVSGSIAFEQASQSLRLADGTVARMDVLAIGGAGLDAFAGLPGPDAPGFSLHDVGFGLAVMAEADGHTRLQDIRWMALKASAGEAAVAGIPLLAASVRSLEVQINQVNGVPQGTAIGDMVLDLGALPLSVATGTGTAIALDIDGRHGEVLRVTGDMSLSVADYFTVSGGFAFEKSVREITLADGTSVAADMLSVGGSGLEAFVGHPDAGGGQGFALHDVGFALALHAAGGEKWLGLKATAGQVGVTGLAGLGLSAQGMTVEINRVLDPAGGRAADRVIDFAHAPLSVPTGPGTSVVLDMAGRLGELTRMSGDVSIAVGGIRLSGNLGFEQSRRTVTLADGSVETVDMLLASGQDASAFIGTGSGDKAFGVNLEGLDFGLAMAAGTQAGDTRAWIALDARAAALGLAGTSGLNLELAGTNASVRLNLAQGARNGVANTQVIDWSAAPVSFTPAHMLDFDDAVMEIGAMAHLRLANVLDAEGGVVLSRHDMTVTADDESVAVSGWLIGAADVGAALEGTSTVRSSLSDISSSPRTWFIASTCFCRASAAPA